ncbi:MAG TPA: PA2169 family four-helix-bundle protein [Xanthomonadales bacterium]|nr:PA2169 family four-helix-bundle protein [Xanthomonadales bacterium]
MPNIQWGKLREVLQNALDGVEFYAAAAERIRNPKLQALFHRIQLSKRAIIDAIRPRLAANGEDVPQAGTFEGVMRLTYAELRADFGDDDLPVFVGQIEAIEDNVLNALASAVYDCPNPELRKVLFDLHAQSRHDHDEMKALRERLAA